MFLRASFRVRWSVCLIELRFCSTHVKQLLRAAKTSQSCCFINSNLLGSSRKETFRLHALVTLVSMETSALQRKGVRREGEVVWGEIRGDVSTLLRMTALRLRVERKQTVSQLCARIACPKISRSRAKERHSCDLEKRETRNARLHSKFLSNTVTGRLFAECSERCKPTNDL